MKKTLLLFVALIALTNLYAQKKGIVFKHEMKPNQSYLVTMDMKSEMVIKLDMDSTMADNPGLAAMQDMKMDMDMRMVMENELGAQVGDSMPFVMVYREFDQSITMNGDPMPTGPNLFEDAKTYGWMGVKGQTMRIDSVSGLNLPPGFENQMNNSLQNMMGQVVFPDKPMKVGDTFEQKVPFEMPMGGDQTGADMDVVTVYTLEEVKGKKAYFSLELTLTMLASNDQMDLGADSDGTGTMVYDLSTNLVEEFNTEMDMVMAMAGAAGPGFNMTAEGKFIIRNTTEIKQ